MDGWMDSASVSHNKARCSKSSTGCGNRKGFDYLSSEGDLFQFTGYSGTANDPTHISPCVHSTQSSSLWKWSWMLMNEPLTQARFWFFFKVNENVRQSRVTPRIEPRRSLIHNSIPIPSERCVVTMFLCRSKFVMAFSFADVFMRDDGVSAGGKET